MVDPRMRKGARPRTTKSVAGVRIVYRPDGKVNLGNIAIG